MRFGAAFAAETGVEILEDPTVVDLYGEQVLLSHGDALCTDDVHYQQIREMGYLIPVHLYYEHNGLLKRLPGSFCVAHSKFHVQQTVSVTWQLLSGCYIPGLNLQRQQVAG